jgi:phenylalanyl-tRNA synthetase beta chain
MKISLSWLADFVDHGLALDELPRHLAMLGLPVESITRIGSEFSGVVVAEVREKAPHPRAEKLTLVKVWDGQGSFDVVCGASNVPAPGGKVLWARPGATLPGGITIGQKELRGVASAGMLCSQAELGLAGGHEGIVVLDGEDGAAPPGATAQAALGLDDVVLDVELTPNRGDCLSHLGVARELAALTGRPLRLPATDLAPVERDQALDLTVTIADGDACPRYTARLIDGLAVGPSPRWLRRRLEAVGVRPISNLVDVTNYVMFELGQPLHAFDAGKLGGGRIEVRRAHAGEKLVTLDAQERHLEPDDLLITDGERAVALAGVMGGADSEVSPATRTVLLEAATFAPRRVRRTARRLGLHSESSHRFERGIDQEGVPLASARAARLLCELGGGRVRRGLVDVEPRPRVRPTIELRPARLAAILGLAVSEAEIRRTLGALGVQIEGQGERLRCTPPSYRLDLELEVDLVEEVVRQLGYDRIPSTLPRSQARPRPAPDVLAERARDALVAAGMSEAITYGFTAPARLPALRLPEGHPARRPVLLKNPLREELSVMRTSLLPNLLAALAHNRAHGLQEVALFEVGSVFLASGKVLPDEPTHVAGVLAGQRAGWMMPAGPIDVFDARGVVERLFASLRIDCDFVPARSEDGFLHPGVGAAILSGGKHVGVVGEIHPQTRDRFGLGAACFAFELDLGALPAPGKAIYQGVPRFPAVVRDLSFFVDDHVPAAQVRAIIEHAAEPLLVQVSVLEDYREAGRVPEGKKGMLWSLVYRAAARTLTDQEVDAAHEKLVQVLLGEIRAQRR